MPTLTARNSDFTTFKRILKEQTHKAHDMVVPSSNLRMTSDGHFVVEDAPLNDDLVQMLRDDGIEPLTNASGDPAADLPYDALDVAHGQIVSKLPIPAFKRGYDFLHDDEPAQLAQLINHYFRKIGKNWLIRTFRPDNEDGTERGIIRAVLSDQYSVINNYDVFMRASETLMNLGIQADVRANLSTRNMYVEYRFPQKGVRADEFVRNYENPHPNRDDGGDVDSRRVYPSFLLRNSEVGKGAFEIQPRLIVQVCGNGIIRSKDALRKIHLGETMQSGVVKFSEKIRRKARELAQDQVEEAVETFVSDDYLYDAINDLLADGANEELEHPREALSNAADEIGLTEEEEKEVEDFFARGRDTRRSAIPNAVSAYAQHVDDPDRAFELEEKAWSVLDRLGQLDFDPEQVN